VGDKNKFILTCILGQPWKCSDRNGIMWFAGFRHWQFAVTKDEAVKGVFIGRCIRVGTKRLEPATRTAGAFRVVGHNSSGMTFGGKEPQTGKEFVVIVRQTLGVLSSVCEPMGIIWPLMTLRRDAEPSADGLKNNYKIR